MPSSHANNCFGLYPLAGCYIIHVEVHSVFLLKVNVVLHMDNFFD